MIEPANQQKAREKAVPNRNLGPAYLMGALQSHGIEVDYLDCTVGQPGRDLKETFFNRKELDNGNIRYGMDPNELYEIFSNYDIIATSSIFTMQTRMHFEIAKIAKKVSTDKGKEMLVDNYSFTADALHDLWPRDGGQHPGGNLSS